MFYRFSQYPELQTRSNNPQLFRLALNDRRTPSLIYLLHFCFFSIALTVIYHLTEALNIYSLLSISFAVFIYLIVFKLIALNTWQRQHFLQHFDSYLSQSLLCPIEQSQHALAAGWVEQVNPMSFTIKLDHPTQQPIHEFGYLMLEHGEEKAQVKVINYNSKQTKYDEISLFIKNAAVIPSSLVVGSRVQLALNRMPIKGTISLTTISPLCEDKPAMRDVSLKINASQTCCLFLLPNHTQSLPIDCEVELISHQIFFKARLVHLDAHNTVAYEIDSEGDKRGLLVGDKLRFDHNDELILTLAKHIKPFGVDQYGRFIQV